MKLIAHIPVFDIELQVIGSELLLYNGIYISRTMDIARVRSFLGVNARDHANKLDYIIFGGELQLEDIKQVMRPHLHEFNWVLEMEKKNYPCPLVNEYSTAAIRCDNIDDCLLCASKNFIMVEDTKLLEELSQYDIGDKIITGNTVHKKGLRIVNYCNNTILKEKIKRKAKKETKETLNQD